MTVTLATDSSAHTYTTTPPTYLKQLQRVTMAVDSKTVATVLNRHTERSFMEALNSRDQQLMTNFVMDYFCEAPETDSEEEEEPGKWPLTEQTTKVVNWLLLLKC